MAYADALTLAETLSMNSLNLPTFERFYGEFLYALAQEPYAVDVSLLSVTALQGTFTIPENVMQILDVWYSNRALDFMSRQALAAMNPTWELERGEPVAYTTEAVDSRVFRIYPLPTEPSDAFIPVFFEPLGRDYPNYNVVLVATMYEQSPPSWLELMLIYQALSREFERVSDHMDVAYAQACGQVAGLLAQLLPLAEVR